MINAGSLTPCSSKIRAVCRGRCALGVNALSDDSGCAGNTPERANSAHMTSRDSGSPRAESRARMMERLGLINSDVDEREREKERERRQDRS